MAHAVLRFSISRELNGNTPDLRGAMYGTDADGRPDPYQHISADSVTPERIETELRRGEIRIHLHGILAPDVSDTTASGLENAVTSTFSDAVSLGVMEVEHIEP